MEGTKMKGLFLTLSLLLISWNLSLAFAAGQGEGLCSPNPCGRGAVCQDVNHNHLSICTCPPSTTGDPTESCTPINSLSSSVSIAVAVPGTNQTHEYQVSRSQHVTLSNSPPPTLNVSNPLLTDNVTMAAATAIITANAATTPNATAAAHNTNVISALSLGILSLNLLF